MKTSDISNYDYDQDIHNPDGWVPAFKAAGVEAVIIGSQWLEKARWQIEKCKAGGLRIIAIYAEPDYDGAIVLAKECGANIIPLAYEPGSIQSHDELWAGIIAVRAAGLVPKIYGNMYDVFWAATDARFHDVGLWFASYFDDHHIITDLSWWPEVWAHQYTSTEYILGKNRDMSEIFKVQEDEEMGWNPIERNLMAVAWGDFGRTLACYRIWRDAGLIVESDPDNPADAAFTDADPANDLNAAMVIRGRCTELIALDSAGAFALVKGDK